MAKYFSVKQNHSFVYSSNGESDRKIILQKVGIAFSFGNKKPKSSEKFTYSLKQIKDGYWEIVIDKTLPPGEYAFTMMGSMMNPGSAIDGSITLFAFGVD